MAVPRVLVLWKLLFQRDCVRRRGSLVFRRCGRRRPSRLLPGLMQAVHFAGRQRPVIHTHVTDQTFEKPSVLFGVLRDARDAGELPPDRAGRS